jgi:hypothetical protein
MEIVKNREQDYLYYRGIAEKSIAEMNQKRILLMGALYQIKNKELFVEGDFNTFEQFCVDIHIQSATGKQYVKIFEHLCITKQIEPEKLFGLPLSKLRVLKGAENPAEYIETAKEQKVQDFKKYVDEKEHGIEPDDDFPVKAYHQCPHWDGDNCKLERI